MLPLFLALMIAWVANPVVAETGPPQTSPVFIPGRVLSVTDVPLVANCFQPTGTVLLDALVTAQGTVQKIAIRCNIPCLAPLVSRAIESWKFSPSAFGSRAVDSWLPVAVNFRPLILYVSDDPVPQPIPESGESVQGAFRPPDVLRAAYPHYPLDTVAVGSVILNVVVGKTGQAETVTVLRDIPRLTPMAKAAVRNWRFTIATYNGAPVRSNMVVVFVFQTVLNTGPTP